MIIVQNNEVTVCNSCNIYQSIVKGDDSDRGDADSSANLFPLTGERETLVPRSVSFYSGIASE